MRSTSQTPSLSFVIGEKKEAKKWLKSTFLEIQIERIIRLRKIKSSWTVPSTLRMDNLSIFSSPGTVIGSASEAILPLDKQNHFKNLFFFTINNYKYIPMTIDP